MRGDVTGAAFAVIAATFLGFVVLTNEGREVAAEALLRTPLPAAWRAISANRELCGWLDATRGLQEQVATARAFAQAARVGRLVRLDGQGHQLWETPFGPWWFPKGASKESVHFAIAQYQVTAYPGLAVRKGDVVLDCGGFVGDWSHWALQAGAAKVVLFEPAAGQLECIRRNLAEPLRDGRVVLIPKGVWDREEELVLSHWDDNPAGHSVTDVRGPLGETISLTTIDRVVEELGLDRVDAIKMDIEGAEVRAVHGARRTLARFRPRLAIATEHTADKFENNRNVIAAVKSVAPFYKSRCGYCGVDRENRILPETLYFDP